MSRKENYFLDNASLSPNAMCTYSSDASSILMSYVISYTTMVTSKLTTCSLDSSSHSCGRACCCPDTGRR